MASFFNQTNTTPQPAFPGFTTTQQAAATTGATPTPAQAPGSNGPQTGKAQGAGQAPQYTNLQQFLSGQSQDQVNSELNPLVNKANTLAQNTQNATNVATKSTTASTTAGVDNGVFGSPATSGSPHGSAAPTTPAPTGLAGIAGAAGSRVGGSNLDSGPTPSAAPQSGVVASTGTSGDPTYDFSKVNLSGYQGPSASDVGGAFGQAQSASAAAQANAAGLASGTPTYNAFDNAVLTKNPGAWSALQASLSGENQATANAAAQQAGAQQGVAQARQASGQAVAAQKEGLTAASGAAASTAAAASQRAQAAAADVTSADPDRVEKALNSGGLQSAGLAPAEAQALAAKLKSGAVSMAQAQAYLKPYVDAAAKDTGYTAHAADQTNQINTLLKTGTTVAGRTVAADQGAAPTGGAGVSNDVAKIKGDAGTLGSDAGVLNLGVGADPNSTGQAGSPQLRNAVADMVKQGYTPEEIAKLTGIDPKLLAPAIKEAGNINAANDFTAANPSLKHYIGQ